MTCFYYFNIHLWENIKEPFLILLEILVSQGSQQPSLERKAKQNKNME